MKFGDKCAKMKKHFTKSNAAVAFFEAYGMLELNEDGEEIDLLRNGLFHHESLTMAK